MRTGFELELLAPRGRSRADLASLLAERAEGTVRPRWHGDAEPSLVPGMGHFLHLTQAFEVRDRHDEVLCTLVDDITLQDDLDPRAPAAPGWYRLLSDDARLLRLVERHVDPAAKLDDVLEPVAALFGRPVQAVGDVRRLDDAAGATVVLGAPLPGERERPCEVVTPPLALEHRARLSALLTAAADLDFTVPREAAVHLHLDAEPFRSARAFANVVLLFGLWRPALWAALDTNPHCRRLGPLPAGLVELATRRAREVSWGQWRAAASAAGLTKFSDVNLTKVVAERPDRHTLEVRLLPGSLDPSAVLRRAALVEALLVRCLLDEPFPAPPPGPVERAVTALRDLSGDQA